MDVKEIEITAPWGKIAAKTWGDEDGPAVLMFHGIEDNANSFDLLVPLLPQENFYISVDLPGHGLSSHFPQGLPVHSMDYILVYRLVCEHFQRSSYTIIGHSYGGVLAMLFSLVYKNFVHKIVLIDSLFPPGLKPEDFSSIAKRHDEFLQVNTNIEKGRDIELRQDKALNMMMKMRLTGCQLTQEATKVLLSRGTKPSGKGKLRFTRDMRMKCAVHPEFGQSYIKEVLLNNKYDFPILLVLTEYSDAYFISDQLYLLEDACMDFKVAKVEGNHHVHLNNPEIVSPVISEFLEAHFM